MIGVGHVGWKCEGGKREQYTTGHVAITASILFVLRASFEGGMQITAGLRESRVQSYFGFLRLNSPSQALLQQQLPFP